MAAQGHRSHRPVRLPAAQYADPAVLGHDRDLGAPRADPRRPRRAEEGPAGDDRARLLFTSIQAYEYIHAPFAFKGNIYGATFFMATGFHGFHVLVGTIFLIICTARQARRLHAQGALRLRSRGLVLALRRRGVAVPVRLHLRLGRLGRASPRLMTPTPPGQRRRWWRRRCKGLCPHAARGPCSPGSRVRARMPRVRPALRVLRRGDGPAVSSS